MQDFDKALSEVTPAFGAVTETLEGLRLNGMIDSGDHHRRLLSTMSDLVQQVTGATPGLPSSCIARAAGLTAIQWPRCRGLPAGFAYGGSAGEGQSKQCCAAQSVPAASTVAFVTGVLDPLTLFGVLGWGPGAGQQQDPAAHVPPAGPAGHGQNGAGRHGGHRKRVPFRQGGPAKFRRGPAGCTVTQVAWCIAVQMHCCLLHKTRRMTSFVVPAPVHVDLVLVGR